MGEKDITEKTLEAYNDVFADIINVLLFDGRQVINEDELEEGSTHSQYKADGKIHEQERDVAKYWKNGNIRIALYGLENQTDVDIDIPLRVISYDGAAYRAQLLADTYTDENGKKKKIRKKRYPVVTLVLYFGYEHRWNKPTSLLECLEIPKELEPFVNDYKANIYEIAWLSDEQVGKFKSDFRIVADYFVQKRKNRDYKPQKPDTLWHVHEILQLLSVLAKDDRFEEAYNENDKGGEITMCEVLDRIENRGKTLGIEEGKALGIEQGKALGIEEGKALGIEQGKALGEDRFAELSDFLIENGMMDDLKRALKDKDYRRKLLDEIVPENMMN